MPLYKLSNGHGFRYPAWRYLNGGGVIGTIAAPSLEWTSTTADDPPTFDATFTDLRAGDVAWLRWYSDSGLTTLVDEVSTTITSAMAGGDPVTFTTGAWGNGTYYVQLEHARTNWTSGFSNAATTGAVTISVASFTDPSSLFGASEAGIWLDFSDTATMWSDASRATTIANGVGIQEMQDKSGNVHVGLQGTSGDRPVWNSAGYATFNGTFPGDRLIFSTPVFNTIPSAFTFFVLMTPVSATAKCSPFGTGMDAANNPVLMPMSTSSGNLTCLINNDAGTSAVSSTALASSYFSASKIIRGIVFDSSGGVKTYINATESDPSITFSNTGSSTAFDKTIVGSTYRNGAYGTLFDGVIYQLVAIGRALNSTEIGNLVTWLGTK